MFYLDGNGDIEAILPQVYRSVTKLEISKLTEILDISNLGWFVT